MESNGFVIPVVSRVKRPKGFSEVIKRIDGFFLDSGVHSLYNEKVGHKGLTDKSRYGWFQTQEFWNYVDDYAAFVKQHKDGIDYYANVDVIFNPTLSWRVLKYLEQHHGLNPIPVVHFGTEMKWLERHLEEGYKYIGIGGLGQEAQKWQYFEWADKVFEMICPKSNNYLPIVKTHGFAMTAFELIIRWPWVSVDSASWIKAGAFGKIYIPHKRNGKFTFDIEPYLIAISTNSPTMSKYGQNVAHLTPQETKIVHDWLEYIGMPHGSSDEHGKQIEWGAYSSHEARGICNLKFFEELVKWLPEWPWAWKKKVKYGLLNHY